MSEKKKGIEVERVKPLLPPPETDALVGDEGRGKHCEGVRMEKANITIRVEGVKGKL